MCIRDSCNSEKSRRYQTLAALKQSLVAVYDVLLGRVDGGAGARQLLDAISNRLSQTQQFNEHEVDQFLDSLLRLNESERGIVLPEVPSSFFRILAIPPLANRCGEFLSIYRPLVEADDYSFGYAEIIASNMQTLFDSTSVSIEDRATALELAVHAATAMHRFNAMETCQRMIKSIENDTLALRVRDILVDDPQPYGYTIEPINCKNQTIAAVIRDLNQQHSAE